MEWKFEKRSSEARKRQNLYAQVYIPRRKSRSTSPDRRESRRVNGSSECIDIATEHVGGTNLEYHSFLEWK